MPFFTNIQRKRPAFKPSLTREEVSSLMSEGGIALPQAIANQYIKADRRVPAWVETLAHFTTNDCCASATMICGRRGIKELQLEKDVRSINQVLKGSLKLKIANGNLGLVSKDSTNYQKATEKLSKCLKATRKAAEEVQLIESTALLAGDKLPELAPEIAEARRALLSGGTIQLTLPEGQ